MLHTQWTEAAIYRPPRRVSLAQQITDELRRRIVTGDLPLGQRLPSIRKLAHLYRVSTPTVESAIHALVAVGLVRVSRGIGTYVAFPKHQMTLLNYVWRMASPRELAIVRAAIDEHAAPLVASQVRAATRMRLPRTLGDILFLAHERSVARLQDPAAFLHADMAFHQSVIASNRGLEIGASLYERVGDRLMETLMPVADVQADDERLDDGHLRLAEVIVAGEVPAAARRARYVALRELRSLDTTLG